MNDTVSEQVRDYVAKVAASLADLPPEARADLVADLEQHLAEVAADSQQPLEASLGAPSAYAEELRASAGLDQSPAGRSGGSLVVAAQRLLDRMRHSPRMAGALRLAEELRPAWWVARGLAPAALVASLSYRSTRGVGWFLAGLIGVVVSVDIGRRRLQRADARLAVSVANVAAALALLLVLVEFVQYGIPVHYETIVEEVPPRHLVHPGGEPITNIYAFDASGAPVTGIFLYDGAGKPIEVRRAAGERYGIQTDFERAPDGSHCATSSPCGSTCRRPTIWEWTVCSHGQSRSSSFPPSRRHPGRLKLRPPPRRQPLSRRRSARQSRSATGEPTGRSALRVRV